MESNTHLPVITVVTVCFNAGPVLEKTLRSVTSQTYANREYLIIDGASKDNTAEVVQPYLDRIDRFVSEPDKGIYDAMNKGIRLATGEWLLFMNADDVFADNDVISDVALFIKDHPEADVIYGDSEQVLEYGVFPVRPQEAYKNHKMSISHQATFVKTDLLRTHLFNLDYHYAADFEQLSHFYLEGRAFVHIDRMIARVEMRGGATYDNTIASAEELYSIIASRNIDIEKERRKIIRHKKMVRTFKRMIPPFLSKPLFKLIAKYYKPL